MELKKEKIEKKKQDKRKKNKLKNAKDAVIVSIQENIKQLSNKKSVLPKTIKNEKKVKSLKYQKKQIRLKIDIEKEEDDLLDIGEALFFKIIVNTKQSRDSSYKLISHLPIYKSSKLALAPMLSNSLYEL